MPTKAPNPVPEGMNTVTPHLWFNGECKKALDLYKKVFNATVIGDPVIGPDGNSILHVMIRVGNSHIMMADALPDHYESGPKENTTAAIFLYVEDCDLLYNKALDSGCEVMEEMMDAFWGDRMGKVKDPFGHCWSIASNKWILTPEEMEQGMKTWLNSLKQ